MVGRTPRSAADPWSASSRWQSTESAEKAGRGRPAQARGPAPLDFRRHSALGKRVEGTVTDDDGNPAPTVNVTMIPDQDKSDWHGRFQNRITDAQGKFTFPALVPGHYTV